MLKSFLRPLSIFILSASSVCHALPLVQADAFSIGDNKAALEVNTGLVWMDFGINSHQSLAHIESELTTTYKGWRLASESEVSHLWDNLFGSYSGTSFLPDFKYLSSFDIAGDFSALFDVFGHGPNMINSASDGLGNIFDTWENTSAFATYRTDDASLGIFTFNSPIDRPSDRFLYDQEALMLNLTGVTDAENWYGALLVKAGQTEVAEPSPFLLLGLGLMLCGARRYLR